MIPDILFAQLRAEPRPAWVALHTLFDSLEEADVSTLEPMLSRWSDEERTFPPRSWEKGQCVPAPALFRHLDLRAWDVAAAGGHEASAALFERTLLDPAVHHVTRLSLGDEAARLTPEMLSGFRALEALTIRTREAFTSAIRDSQCAILAGAPSLSGLRSLTIEYCDVRGPGVAALVGSPNLHALRTLELYIPARTAAMKALAAGSEQVLSGIATLGLGADHLTGAGAAALVGAAARFTGLRTLRIFAMDSNGLDWCTPFDAEGEKNVRALARALSVILRGFGGLERLEVRHGSGGAWRVSEGAALRAMNKPAEIQRNAFPRSMSCGA